MLSSLNKLNIIIKNNKLTQLIDKSTRVTLTSATLLDLIIGNETTHISEKCIAPHVTADHDLIGNKETQVGAFGKHCSSSWQLQQRHFVRVTNVRIQHYEY